MEHGTLGKNIEDVQKNNQASILHVLSRCRGVLSRKQLSDLVGLTPATVTNIVRDLMEAGYIMETGFLSGKRGRRAVGLAINPEGFYVLGVRLSRSTIACRIFNPYAEVLHSKTAAIADFEQTERVLEQMLDCMEAVVEESGVGSKVQAIGLSTPGPLNLKEGKIAYLHGATDWRDVPIKDLVYERFRVPTIVEHDANAAALAEYTFGKSAENQDLIYVAVGRGIGVGVVLEGEIHHGSQGTAGLLGHVSVDYNGPECDCGGTGCLTNYASSKAFLRRMEELGLGPAKNLEDYVALAHSGHDLVRQEVERAAFFTGVAVASAVNLLGCNVVIFGDEMTWFGPLWFDKAKETLLSRLAPNIARGVEVKLSAFGQESFLLGTAAIAMECVYQNPVTKVDEKELNQ